MDSGSTKELNLTRITDLDIDSLGQCARYLSLRDLSNMAATCKLFKTSAYSDSVWHPLFRDKWPEEMLHQYSPGTQVRKAYLARRRAIMQFSFVDPLVTDFYTDARPFSHILLGKEDIIFSQGSLIQILKIHSFIKGKDCLVSLRDHNARITCMRLFPFNEASFTKTETKSDENLLITSSCDHSIRLWWKGSCFRSYKGHSGPVSTLSDKLLGDEGSRVLASGGEDGTVRLWSLSSSGKRGQQALSATLHGHEKPVKLLAVSGHRSSLLISVATDSKIRVWDSTLASSSRTSTCVGMASMPGAPVGIKCFESMLYVATGYSVHAIDLRTMKKSFTAAVSKPHLYSFEMLPTRSLLCTGGSNRALLWDIRKSQEGQKLDPIGELEGHNGPVKYVHMDPYKTVTGGPYDFYTNVFDVESGTLVNSLNWGDPELLGVSMDRQCHAMAVDGPRIVTAGCDNNGFVRFRDFSNASCSVSTYEDQVGSKFWNSKIHIHSDSEE